MGISKLLWVSLVPFLFLLAIVEASPAEGEWEVPQNTFTIPVSNPSNGLYIKDIQNSYQNVDWETLDRLYIPAGDYKLLKIGNLPERSADRPLIITNQGGQVTVGGMGHYYLMVLSGGTNWILTGKYDEVAQTGHADFPGHGAGGDYANSQGTYGIMVDDLGGRAGNSGIAVGDRQEATSDFSISFVEVRNVGFAGFLVKSDNFGSATMKNVKLHDNYIHDTGSEGLYLGSTQGGDQHSFEDLKVYNNRILRSGTEGLQAGQLGSGCEIHHNVVALSAIDWKDAFQNNQHQCAQIQHRYGSASVHHNIFIGAGGSLLNFFAMNNVADTHAEGDTFSIHDNYFASSRMLGIYMGQRNEPYSSTQTADDITAYEISNNTFRQFDFQQEELNPTIHPPSEIIRDGMPRYMENTISMGGNTFDSPNLDNLKLTKPPYCPWVDLNAESCRTTAVDNARELVEPVAFANFFEDISSDVDYLLMEKWAEECGRCTGDYTGTNISYEAGDYVFHERSMYQAIVPNTGIEPGSEGSDSYWEQVPDPVDDVRLACDSTYAGIGLLDTLDSCSNILTSEDRDQLIVDMARRGLEAVGNDTQKFDEYLNALEDLVQVFETN